MKITHVVRQFHPGIGGMENYVAQLATRQAAAGHAVRVATLDRIFADAEDRTLPCREQWQGVEIVRTRFLGSRRYPFAPGVLKALGDADIVHVHGVDFFADFLALTRVFHRKPLVLTTHGGFFHTSFARGLKQFYLSTITRAALSQYGAVIACSAEDERMFRKVAGARLILIPNPVDIDKFAGLADPTSDTIIYFGRLAPNKEPSLLLDWFAGFARTQSAARLIMAGKPMGVDPDALQARANELGISDKFELHVTPSDGALADLIACSGSYACASSYEGFGLAAVEAASAGLLPLLSKIPPFQDTIERLGFGMLIDFTRPETWATSYREVMVERSRFRDLHDQTSVQAAVAPFDWHAAVPRFDEVYAQILGFASRRIGKVRIDVIDREAAAASIWTAAGKQAPLLSTFGNAHTVNLARKDTKFRDLLGGFQVLNDGVGVDIASRNLYGRPFPENLNGTDFTPYLLRQSPVPLRLYLIGSRPGVAERAAHSIGAHFPGTTVVGTHDGFFAQADEAQIAAAIAASGANLVLAAMGQPRQEFWAARASLLLDCPILCVGALLDFLADEVPRAPDIIRRLRLEWMFRLTQEPRRLASRYLLGNATFLASILKQRWIGPRI